MTDNFAVRLKQANIVSKNYIANFVETKIWWKTKKLQQKNYSS